MSINVVSRGSDNSSDEEEIARKFAEFLATHKASKSKPKERLHMVVRGSPNSRLTGNNNNDNNITAIALESFGRELKYTEGEMKALKEELISDKERIKCVETANGLLHKELERLKNKNKDLETANGLLHKEIESLKNKNSDLIEKLDQQNIKFAEQEDKYNVKFAEQEDKYNVKFAEQEHKYNVKFAEQEKLTQDIIEQMEDIKKKIQ